MKKIFTVIILLFIGINGFSQARILYNVNSPEFKAARDSAEKAYIENLEKSRAEQNERNARIQSEDMKRNREYSDSLKARKDREERRIFIEDSIAEVKAKRLQIQQNKEWAAKQKAIKEANAKKQEEHNKWLIDTYGYDIANKMAKHQVVIGWTKEMCIESWGKPYSVNKTINAYTVNEQWVYGYTHFLYFDNGILTTIQE